MKITSTLLIAILYSFSAFPGDRGGNGANRPEASMGLTGLKVLSENFIHQSYQCELNAINNLEKIEREQNALCKFLIKNFLIVGEQQAKYAIDCCPDLSEARRSQRRD